MPSVLTTAIDQTTSLFIFGLILAVLIVTYATVCIQYIVIQVSPWQHRREMKGRKISNHLHRFVAHGREMKKLSRQLKAEVVLSQSLADCFNAYLACNELLHQVEANNYLEALRDECYEQNRVIGQPRKKGLRHERKTKGPLT
ncbi:hypothetical protein PENANT_c030G04883 [Penicillium antarcticum]|uniref:Uncharacterized protein n=1 Tax=Penicillium antarcticum TaxID=416450 RepID=A0A1V6PX62_9EURO|nr:uncharacterized protein N7508_001508 [Penicillium antarcticum]KAJ5317000.1 hypothetical protein N7508_001508 [Penicillium antarcticum]OQD81046.1 hypothetical protein PENANT_c030G04883 [Penicillium antarcticum]